MCADRGPLRPSLATAPAAGSAIYGTRFNPEISLRALLSFDDGDLLQLDELTKEELRTAVSLVSFREATDFRG
ncbi:MAG: hypothetical protein JWO91_3730 [Acidobacteriaceae bacterium]|nr:hypothetical protein [Acidobacteriaceae bacterium]